MGVRRRARATKASRKKKDRSTGRTRYGFPPLSKGGLIDRARTFFDDDTDRQRADLAEVLHDCHFKGVPLTDLDYAVRCFISDGQLDLFTETGLQKQDVERVARTIAARFDFAASREPLRDGMLSEAIELLSRANDAWLARRDAASRA